MKGGNARGRQGVKRAAIAVGLVTLAAWATVLGWFMHDWLSSDRVEVVADRPVEVFAPETVIAGRVPNVVGLSEDDARRALSDAGVDLEAVTARSVPYVGPADLVVQQEPPSGRPVEDGQQIVLDVSTPARMPTLDGSQEGEARAELAALGARVVVVNQYQPGAEEGTVLSTDPAAGELLSDRATLHVAEPLSSVFLSQLNPVASSCRTAEGAVVAGATHEEAIVCQPELGAKPRSATYALGGEVESLRADLGLDDRGNPDVPVMLQVYVDGELALSRRLEFGDSLPVEVALLGKLQLRLEASAMAAAEAGSLPVRAAFANARLIGSRSAIDRVFEGLGG